MYDFPVASLHLSMNSEIEAYNYAFLMSLVVPFVPFLMSFGKQNIEVSVDNGTEKGGVDPTVDSSYWSYRIDNYDVVNEFVLSSWPELITSAIVLTLRSIIFGLGEPPIRTYGAIAVAAGIATFLIPVWIGFENAEKFLMPLYFEGTMLYSTLLFFFIFSAVSYLILEKLERSRILSIIMIIFYTISVIAGVMNGIGEEESIHIATYLWGLFLEIASILYLEGAAEMVKEKTGLENLIEETESGRAKGVLVPLQLVGALTIAIMLMSMIGGVGMAIDRSPPNISIISWELNETDTGTAEASLTFSINITELGNITEATEQGEISSRIMDFGIIVVEANESGTPK